VIEPIHNADPTSIVQTSHEERQPPPRRRPQRRPDQTPGKKVYTPQGILEEEEAPHIDVVG
jgi:hypothetical protein